MKSRFLAFTQKMPLPKAHSHGRRHFTSLRAARGFALLQTIIGHMNITLYDRNIKHAHR